MVRVVTARFLSRAGSEAAFFVGIWGKTAFELDAGPSALAMLMFGVSVASILGSTVAGVLIDRYGPRRVLMVAEVLFVPAALAFAAAQTITQVALIAGIWAFLGAPVVTAGATFAPYLTSGTDGLKRMNAWIEGAGSLAFAIGPGAGALLVTFADVDWVFVLDAATSAIAALLVIPVHLIEPNDDRSGGTGSHHALAEMREGLRTVYGIRNIRYYVLTGSLIWLSFGAFGALEPLFFRDVVGTGVETIGYMNSVFGVGFLIGAASLSRLPRRLVCARGLNLFMFFVGLGAVLYVGSTDLRVIAVGAFVWASVIGLMEPLLRTLIHRDTPRQAVGRVMGISEVHRRAGELIPLGVAPALASIVGVQWVLIGGGLVASAISIATLREASAVDHIHEEAVSRGESLPQTEIEIAPLKSGEEPVNPTP